MAEIIRRAKPLAVNPLKASQPVGAALAFLGLRRALPLMHGSQGCTAFAKVFLVRHFREPIPLQTTAMDQIATVMGADENVVQALATIAEKQHPAVIGLCTTGLAETQGTDIRRCIHEFRAAHPEFADVHVVPVNSTDTVGCLETGFALAVEAIIDTMVEKSALAGRRPQQVNVLAGSLLTPGDIEAVKEWIEAFGLRAVVLPDLADSLDGHLVDAEFTPLTVGGTPATEIVTLGEAAATLVIGPSLYRAADKLKDKTGVPDYRFDGLMGLDACDAFTQALAAISGKPVPEKIERQRAQLQDAMVDAHFMTGCVPLALAADPDLLGSLARFLIGVGAEIAIAVTPVKAAALESLPIDAITIGDLEDLEQAAVGGAVKLVIANSHAVASARRLGVPLLRAGFPQYDWVGGYTRAWVGYRGTRQTLFDIANLILGQHHDIAPYRSLFWQDGPRRKKPARQLRLVWSTDMAATLTLRVAFASDDRARVNQHFGAAEGFIIYDVGIDRTNLVAVGEFPATAMDGNEDNASAQAGSPTVCNHSGWTSEGRHKLASKIDFLAGSAAVFVMAIGASAIKQLLAAAIQPVRVTDSDQIEAILADIQNGMRAGGVPWIDKALAAQKSPDRFAQMAEETWTGLIAHAGQVRHIAAGRALVAVATSGCASCGQSGGCGIGKLAGQRRETLIALAAPDDLRVGDAVTLELDEAQVTRAALLGYLLPACLLIGGALIGESAGANVGAGGTAADGHAVLGAVAGLLGGLFLTRLRRPLPPRLSRSIFISPQENHHV